MKMSFLPLNFLSNRSAGMATCGVALALLAVLPSAHAHRTWLLPSATVLSGAEPWVTVDAAVSNDLFYFEHTALSLDGLSAIGPDGKPVQIQNPGTGRYRNTFDVKLSAPGTYRLAVVNDNLIASYQLNGESKRWRGAEANYRKEIPAAATDVKVSRMHSRVETFVTAGKPNDTALKATGVGIELVAVSHPNDLFQSEQSTFKLLLDGQSAKDLKVSIIQSGIRYQDKLTEMALQTDSAGQFSVKWPSPGMYWINASYPAQRGAGMVTEAAGTIDQPARRASYSLTVEVLPQ